MKGNLARCLKSFCLFSCYIKKPGNFIGLKPHLLIIADDIYRPAGRNLFAQSAFHNIRINADIMA
jgi:hypothetical protein